MHQFGEKAANKKFRLSSKMKTQFDQETIESANTQRNVKFSDRMVDNLINRKKHRSTSILKKRSLSNFEKGKTRSESINSMSGQSPKDDQSCENSNINKVIKDEYATLLKLYGKKGHYVDELFPPVISSLFSYAGRKKNKAPQTIKWKRISQVFSDRQLIMWGSDPSKNNICSTSGLASKYFIQGLNCVKSSKEILRKMFETQKPNLQGVYFVKIFQGSIWKYVIIDDNIPVIEVEGSKKEKYQPAFINCQLRNIQNKKQPIQIWPFLLEKALAKLYSSYQALQNGNIFDFLQEITNQACQYYSLEAKQLNLNSMFKNPQVLAFAQNTPEDTTPIFSCVGQSEKISFVKGNKQKMIINPDQLPKYFNHLYILGWKKFNYIGHCPIRQAKQSISVRYFEVKNPMLVGLTLNQKDQRHFQENIKYHYSWVRFIVLQKQFNGGYRWIDGRYDNQKSMTIETDLQVGQYYVIIMPEWQNRAYDLNLIIRAKMPIKMQRKPYQEGMIEAGCTDLAQRFGRLNQINSYICSYNCVHEDLGMVVQNVNNERMRGCIRIFRCLDSLKSSHPIEIFNKQFRNQKQMQITIKNDDHFTVVLLMKKGIDRQFFENFDFNGK